MKRSAQAGDGRRSRLPDRAGRTGSRSGGVLVTAEDHEISGGHRTGRILVRAADPRSRVPRALVSASHRTWKKWRPASVATPAARGGTPVIPASVIDEIRARIDPVEVIGRRVELKKSGTSFSASCPFHADRTPSFRVFPDSKRFKCFGCGARGDVFEFLRRFEGKGFPTPCASSPQRWASPSLRKRRAPRPVEPVEPGSHGLDRACEAAMTHWSERLWSGRGSHCAALPRGTRDPGSHRPAVPPGLRAARVARPRAGAGGAGLHGGRRSSARASSGESDNADHPTHDRFRGRVIFPLLQGDRRVVGLRGAHPAAGVAVRPSRST